MTRSTLIRGALAIAVLVTVSLAVRTATATCELDSGVKLVNGTTAAIAVTVKDSCDHVVSVTVPSGEYALIPASSGKAHILWGSSGENTPDLSRGQVFVQQL